MSVAVGVLVIAAWAGAHDIPSQVPKAARAMKNPLAGDPAAVEAGGTLYTTLCASCHGASGKGDGPAAAGLAHRPPDMTTSLTGQTDGEVRWKITRGGGAMPSYQKTLAETDRWRLVAFLRSLGDVKDGRAR
jgi:mono/diheme cytochrome c family protein